MKESTKREIAAELRNGAGWYWLHRGAEHAIRINQIKRNANGICVRSFGAFGLGGWREVLIGDTLYSDTQTVKVTA